jgi:hypothetical protein
MSNEAILGDVPDKRSRYSATIKFNWLLPRCLRGPSMDRSDVALGIGRLNIERVRYLIVRNDGY